MARGQFADERADLADLVRVEAGRRFVEDDDVGFVDDRLRDADALLVALRQRADESVAHVDEAAAVAGPDDGGGDIRTRHAVQLRGDGQVFVDREVAVERRRLGQVTDAGLRGRRLFEEVDAADPDLARRRREVAGQHLHRRGLAGAVRAEKAQDFAAGEGQRHVAHGAAGTVIA